MKKNLQDNVWEKKPDTGSKMSHFHNSENNRQSSWDSDYPYPGQCLERAQGGLLACL